MAKRISISLSEWILDEILKDVKNRSNRIEELIIKGWIEEIKS